jgi:hypothetical protein
MKGTISLAVVLAALVALATAPLATAKLPPGTTFEACGQSGCNTATDEESFQLQLKLIEPAMEHGTVAAPSVSEPWIRIDLNAKPTRGMRPLLRSFPVVFARDAGYIGVPSEQGTYRWVQLRLDQADGYRRLADGVSPFAPRPLAELDPMTVARANPAAAEATPAGSEKTPTALIISLVAAGLLVGAQTLGATVRRRRRRRRTGPHSAPRVAHGRPPAGLRTRRSAPRRGLPPAPGR